MTKADYGSSIFISDCGEFIAIRIPGLQPNFDVWKHDGSEYWEGERYVELPDKRNHYNPRRLFTESFAQPQKIVVTWSKVKGETFEVLLRDMVTKKTIIVKFNIPLKSLSPRFENSRGTSTKHEFNNG